MLLFLFQTFQLLIPFKFKSTHFLFLSPFFLFMSIYIYMHTTPYHKHYNLQQLSLFRCSCNSAIRNIVPNKTSVFDRELGELVIDMTIQAQLYANNVGFCGNGFTESCLNTQQLYMQQQLQQLEPGLQQLCNERQSNQHMFLDTNFCVSRASNNLPPIPNCQSASLQFEMQGQDIDRCIRLQDDKLRIKLQEQSKQQVAILLKNMELNMLYLLKQKDEEIALEVKKRMELEDFSNKLEAENQILRRVAAENQAVIFSLNNALEEMKEKAYNVYADDVQSCCDESEEMEEEEEDDKPIMRKMIICRSCNSGMSCVLFLPCRHLSSCKDCEAFLESCPLCRMPKKSSIETVIF